MIPLAATVDAKAAACVAAAFLLGLAAGAMGWTALFGSCA